MHNRNYFCIGMFLSVSRNLVCQLVAFRHTYSRLPICLDPVFKSQKHAVEKSHFYSVFLQFNWFDTLFIRIAEPNRDNAIVI